MKISKAEIDQIIGTLPIGYYAKRKVNVKINDTSDSSFYNPITDTIEISYAQVQKAMEKVEDGHKDEMIRSNLYHELSHAILTPYIMTATNVMNIFEDERIETLLRDFYYDVDFEKSIYYMNGLEVGEVRPPQNSIQAFYNLVRFRNGPAELVAEVDKIINKYRRLNKYSDYFEVGKYECDVQNLYDKIEQDYNDKEEMEKMQEMNGQSQNKDGDTKEAGEAGTQETNSSNPSTKEGDGEIKAGTISAHGKSNVNPLSMGEFTSISAVTFAEGYDKKTHDTFKMIIDNFKKKSGGGCAMRAYSGIINPRSVRFNDYRIFDRMSTAKGDNQFGTCHLNLFIDRSGSFCGSANTVNRMIAALTKIEEESSAFSLDLVFCGDGEKLITDKSERYLECDGGNDLDNEIFEIYRKLQKPNTCNYNIALFDGDAFSDCYGGGHYGNFRAFDFSNCTIISDYSNKDYIDKTVSRARVILTRDYTDELLKNVQTALEIAFR